jgi:4-hydroxy-3-methylbut-2-en-1-yl diphosphate reductase
MVTIDYEKIYKAISEPRFSRYLNETYSKEKAFELYQWNIKLSQAFYFELNAWEITLRNKCDDILCMRFGKNWHRNNSFIQNLTKHQLQQLNDVTERCKRRKSKITKGDIISDLTASFWVAILAKKKWNVFGFQVSGINVDPNYFHQLNNEILKLRNRIAHYEPIIFTTKSIKNTHDELLITLSLLCKDTHAHVHSNSTFIQLYNDYNEAMKTPLKILLCSPRGFCAGVVRAIDAVELALKTYGAPVYVRHEIVHNRFVVESLKAKGAIFVEELDEIPDTDAPVIFSAHGVPKSVPADAKKRNFLSIDATCPLVTKVHREAEIHHKRGRQILLIGHAGHPEVIGTMGQLPPDTVTLIETAADARAFTPSQNDLAYVTQTTLSLDDTREIITILSARFPHITHPHKEDICYATTNRQEAVKKVAPQVEAMIVVGAPNSSNSQRLKEVAEREGCVKAQLVQRADEIDWSLFSNIKSLGITAGASAPEVLVEEIIEQFAARYTISIDNITAADENVFFPLPRLLREAK